MVDGPAPAVGGGCRGGNNDQSRDSPKVRLADLEAHRARRTGLPSEVPDSQQAVFFTKSFTLTGRT